MSSWKQLYVWLKYAQTRILLICGLIYTPNCKWHPVRVVIDCHYCIHPHILYLLVILFLIWLLQLTMLHWLLSCPSYFSVDFSRLKFGWLRSISISQFGESCNDSSKNGFLLLVIWIMNHSLYRVCNSVGNCELESGMRKWHLMLVYCSEKILIYMYYSKCCN